MPGPAVTDETRCPLCHVALVGVRCPRCGDRRITRHDFDETRRALADARDNLRTEQQTRSLTSRPIGATVSDGERPVTPDPSPAQP